MSLPYTTKLSSIEPFLHHVANDGIPEKVTRDHLESIGLTSSNDRPLIPLFKELGFIGSSGAPTKRWRAYRDKGKAKGVLAQGIREAYPEFFQVYTDANRKDNEALRNIVKAKTSLGEKSADAVVRTFKTLSEKADFESTEAIEKDVPDGSEGQDSADDDRSDTGGRAHAPAIAVNIQLELPKDADESAYEKLFAAMRKHLFEDH